MCSYCGCRSITVIGRFSEEHDEIVDAAGELRRAAERADLEELRARVHDLGHLLHSHTASEEHGLFGELRQDPEFTEHVDRLCSEHADLDARLEAIGGGDVSGVGEFIRRLRDHIDREENGLFPAAAIAIDGPGWERVSARTPPSQVPG